jgi:hypothetical protein
MESTYVLLVFSAIWMSLLMTFVVVWSRSTLQTAEMPRATELRS